jgi:hypothetical protein
VTAEEGAERLKELGKRVSPSHEAAQFALRLA